MRKSNYTILTCFLLFANFISYLFSTIVCEIFEIRKKRISRMAVEWFLRVSLPLYFSLIYEKQTMCYFTYEYCAIKLCGCIVWRVILFSVLKNTIAILPIHQHPLETLTGTDLVAGPWRAPGWAGNSQGHLWLCCRDKRQECNIWSCRGCDQEKVKYVYWWGESETRESSELGSRKKTNKKTPEKWHTASTMGKVKGFRTQSLRHTFMVACYVKDPF